MKLEDIQSFIQVAKEEGVKELNYEEKGLKLSVTLPTQEDAQIIERPAPQSGPQKEPAQQAPVSKSDDPNLTSVTSPIVGTFYNSPSPDSEPYVQVGDKVKKGQVLCIIEAMKIMNEIEAESNGEIVEICLENENYVEYGEVLFKIRPS